MKLEHVLQTRCQAPMICIPHHLQERRIVRTCVALVLAALLFLLTVPDAHAQSVYTKSNLPVVGLKYARQWAKPAVVDPQAGGLNQTWNFSPLANAKGRIDTIEVVDAKKVIGEVPPEANVAIVNKTTNLRDYYNTLKPSLRNLGYEDGTVKSLLGSSPYDIDPIPVKLNSTITSKYDGSVQVVNSPELSINRSGTLTFTPDGTGTLLLPLSPIIHNVIRVRWTDDRIDTVLRNDQPAYAARTQLTRYVWYSATSALEYLVVSHGDVKFTRITEDPPKDSLINETQYYINDFGASPVEEFNDASLRVVPNPASDQLHIQGQCSSDRNVTVRLFTLIGEEVMSVNIPTSNGAFDGTFSLRECLAQHYIVRVEVDGIERNTIISVVR